MLLLRTGSNDEGTQGILVFNGTFIHTIELPWRDNRSNISCIPTGKYKVSMRHSPKYGKVFHVESVPRRTHILMHHGNFAGDKSKGYRTHSAGCIILGSKKGRLYGQQAVLGSRTARRKLESTMNWDSFKLEIIDA